MTLFQTVAWLARVYHVANATRAYNNFNTVTSSGHKIDSFGGSSLVARTSLSWAGEILGTASLRILRVDMAS